MQKLGGGVEGHVCAAGCHRDVGRAEWVLKAEVGLELQAVQGSVSRVRRASVSTLPGVVKLMMLMHRQVLSLSTCATLW